MLRILKNFTILIILLTMALLQFILKIITTIFSKVNTSIIKIYKKIKKATIKRRNRFLSFLLKLSRA